MKQWTRELHTWAPQYRVNILHASSSANRHGKSRDGIVKTVVDSGVSFLCFFFFVSSIQFHVLSPLSEGILITTYEGFRIQADMILAYQSWLYMILDEGHKIRNPDAEVTIACKRFVVCLFRCSRGPCSVPHLFCVSSPKSAWQLVSSSPDPVCVADPKQFA